MLQLTATPQSSSDSLVLLGEARIAPTFEAEDFLDHGQVTLRVGKKGVTDAWAAGRIG